MKKTLLILIQLQFMFMQNPAYSQTINITSTGTLSIPCSEYENNMNRIWNINISGDRKLRLDYNVNIEPSNDNIYIYSVLDSVTTLLQATLTGSQTGSLHSFYPNGKMRIIFTSNGSENCSTNPTYEGFTIDISKIMGISYTYDTSGNRTDREIVLDSGASLRSGLPESEAEEPVYNEKINYPFEKGINEANIRIYPNPTEGRFAIEISGVPDEVSGKIFLLDMGGKPVDRKNIRSERQIEFDLSRKPAGIYILNIQLEGQTSTWKIVKK
jgi:hypothetical protein